MSNFRFAHHLWGALNFTTAILPFTYRISDSWKKLSISGKRNRNTADSQGATTRHTGGSIGFDEHRVMMRKLLGREPDWIDVFWQRHLIAASKAKYFTGDAEGLRFCNETAEAAYDAYKKALLRSTGTTLLST